MPLELERSIEEGVVLQCRSVTGRSVRKTMLEAIASNRGKECVATSKWTSRLDINGNIYFG